MKARAIIGSIAAALTMAELNKPQPPGHAHPILGQLRRTGSKYQPHQGARECVRRKVRMLRATRMNDGRHGLIAAPMPIGRRVTRVTLDGRDIEVGLCYAGDDREGWLLIRESLSELFARQPRGGAWRASSLRSELLVGEVRFEVSDGT